MSPHTERTVTIAIAEDHPQMRDFIVSYFKGSGFTISITASDGKELLSLLAKASSLPDICLLDINMPFMKGYEAADVIRNLYPEIKMAALSANFDTSSLLKMLHHGCGTYLSKSQNPSEWIEAVQGLSNDGYYYTDWMSRQLLEHLQSEMYASF